MSSTQDNAPIVIDLLGDRDPLVLALCEAFGVMLDQGRSPSDFGALHREAFGALRSGHPLGLNVALLAIRRLVPGDQVHLVGPPVAWGRTFQRSGGWT